MYGDLIGLVIDKTDSRFDDFPSVIEGEVYLSGNPEEGWSTREYVPMTQANIEKAIQTHIDSIARANGFDNINSIGKFVGYDNLKRIQAESLGVWCANVWDFAEVELAKVEAGTRELPETLEAMIAELPVYV